jgi:cephalosporin hydroxylase
VADDVVRRAAVWARTKTLDELGVQYETDKCSWGHGYCRVYDELFTPLRHQPINLLELGVCYGDSMRMWADYFTHPDTLIYGIDLWPASWRGARPGRVRTFEGDQAQIPEGWPDPALDVVIDDASHVPAKTEASFRRWWPAVKPGGFYIVEDTSYQNTVTLTPADDFLKSLVDEVNHHPIRADCWHGSGFKVDWLRFSFNLCIVKKAVP